MYKNKIFPENRYLFSIILLFAVVALISSCKKLIEITPPKNSTVSPEVFSNDALATAAIVGMYSKLATGGTNFITGGATIAGALSSDELLVYDITSEYGQLQSNTLTSNTGLTNSWLWVPCYQNIYRANAAIEGLEQFNGVAPSLKNQLLGEAKFFRGLGYFYLVNFFGDVPLVLTTNWNNTSSITQASKEDVYQSIISDLQEASTLLSENYSYSNNERTRANKYAAEALLARTFLFRGNWKDAEANATSVINSTLYRLENNPDSVFLKNSAEAILQLQQSNALSPYNVTWDGYLLIPTSSWNFSYINIDLVNSFEQGDLRKKKWIDSSFFSGSYYYYPKKYRESRNQSRRNNPITQYYMVLRLSEQYLIRAEARTQENDLTNAISDLNIVRKRAGLSPVNGSLTQQQVFDAIRQERRVELFTEMGNRWFDLKRWGKADAILGPIKGNNWQTTDQLYPIPSSELIKDPNLTQNAGYY